MDIRKNRVEKLRQLVEQVGTIASFAKSNDGVDPTYVSQLLNGHRAFGEKAARNMESRLGLDAYYLDQSDATEVPTLNGSNGITITQFEAAGAMGNGIELPDQPGTIQNWGVDKAWLEQNVRSFTSAKNLCIVTGFGDSMQPMFNPGDPLLVDTGVETVEFDAVYFFRIESQGYIKRLQRIPTENGLILRAISENRQSYEAFDITENMDFQVLGRVLKVWCSVGF